MKQSLTIKIVGNAKDDTRLTASWKWNPPVNTKQQEKNHAAVLEMGFRLIDAIGVIAQKQKQKLEVKE